MKIEISNKGPDQIEIKLSGDLGIEIVDELHQLLKIRMANSRYIQLILDHPSYIDLSVYQLLVAASVECKKTGKEFSLVTELDPECMALSQLAGFTPGRLNTKAIINS